MKKKIVLISHSTMPSNSPRAHRTHELAVELARVGHDITLYVADNGYDYKHYCDKFNIKVKFMGPLYFYQTNPYKGISLSFVGKSISKVFGQNIQFPFIELVYHTYRVLRNETNIDLLITIAVPYPIHWGTALYKAHYPSSLFNTVWIADCGDPFVGDLNKYKLLPPIPYLHNLFYKSVDYLTVPTKESIEGYLPEYQNKIRVIPQGFNFRQTDVTDGISIKNDIPTFIYAGSFYHDIRNPTIFLEYLTSIDKDFKFIVYTKSIKIIQSYTEKLGSRIEIRDYIPRLDLIDVMSQADFLINLENKSSFQTPSKLIDYALSGRPILSINPDNALDTSLINDFINGIYDRKLVIQDIEQYNIKNVANSFLNLSNNKKY